MFVGSHAITLTQVTPFTEENSNVAMQKHRTHKKKTIKLVSHASLHMAFNSATNVIPVDLFGKKMLSVTPTFNKPQTLCSSLTEVTTSLLRERVARAHKWTKASAVTPSAANHWLAPHS